jgi:multiple sugar transport system permease protein
MGRILRAAAGRHTTHRQARALRHRVVTGLIYAQMVIVAVVFMLPLYWAINTSLKPYDQVFTEPPRWFPSPVMWSNYVDVLTGTAFPFLRLLGNTLFYAGLSTVGVVLSSCLVAYGFARVEFRGRDVLFGITLATMMLPGIVTLIPTYVLFRCFGWVGSYAPLIVPAFFGNAFNIFLLRQFFMGIPWELSDAARVDGSGEFYTLWRIMVPLVKPALLVVAIFHFLFAWNDFMGPLIYLDDPTNYTLVLGLSSFQTQHGIMWNLIMAASMVTFLPLVILFFLGQRYFIEGVTLTGLKG